MTWKEDINKISTHIAQYKQQIHKQINQIIITITINNIHIDMITYHRLKYSTTSHTIPSLSHQNHGDYYVKDITHYV